MFVYLVKKIIFICWPFFFPASKPLKTRSHWIFYKERMLQIYFWGVCVRLCPSVHPMPLESLPHSFVLIWNSHEKRGTFFYQSIIFLIVWHGDGELKSLIFDMTQLKFSQIKLESISARLHLQQEPSRQIAQSIFRAALQSTRDIKWVYNVKNKSAGM